MCQMDGSKHMMDLDPGVGWLDPGIRTYRGSRSKCPIPRSSRLVDLDPSAPDPDPGPVVPSSAFIGNRNT
ncbi:unnamed protein product [Phytophthora fragariaefolia]|uniref:Unnamed protein product n=1 Tax=Phytophthora fragariaefolia TaxID=1490495 RepID=A0A9W6YGV1_9STRA|nr:unnamed protein product [Phytophthora fragariaefolia]